MFRNRAPSTTPCPPSCRRGSGAAHAEDRDVGRAAGPRARPRSRQVHLTTAIKTGHKTPEIIPNVERVLRQRVELLERTFAPTSGTRARQLDDALTEKGRATIRDLLGKVRVVEDGEDFFAELNLGRAVYISHGAQERT
jgi:hypothetical protein